MKEILKPWVGKEVGCNIQKPFHIITVVLEKVEDDYFVLRDDNDNLHHMGYHSIVQIITNENGVDCGGGLFEHKHNYPLVIKIGHIIEYVPG